MNDACLILAALKARWFNNVLSILLTACGVMIAVMVLLFGHHLQSRIAADTQGIDIVIGAKGSPLQLILSAVYHVDIPTGNISYEDARQWMTHPQVARAIPLALGDNWRGTRIVGTTHDYIAHYGGQLAAGRLWEHPFEAVAGADVDIAVGDDFVGAHGLIEGGHVHDDETYHVVGRLEPTGTVLDRLLLTAVDSVLLIHGMEAIEGLPERPASSDHHEHSHSHDHHHHDDHGSHHSHDDHHHDHDHHHHSHSHDGAPELTALLITVRAPVALMNLPRVINRESALQAANPAYEMARLTAMMGLGAKTLSALATLLVIVAALSIFTGLAGSLESRSGHLAMLRALGYSRPRIFKIITAEGLLVVICGLALGLACGYAGFAMLTEQIRPLSASGARAIITPQVMWLGLAVLVAGLVAASIPALRAARIDVARQLARDS